MKTGTTDTTSSPPETAGLEGGSTVQDKGLLHLGELLTSLESKLQALYEADPPKTKRRPDSEKNILT